MSAISILRNAVALPDNGQWTNRFEIRSASSNRVYVVAQNKATKKWGCSCPGYCIHRKCKHLVEGCGLPEHEIHGSKKIAPPPKRARIGR